uniref:Uncharacterized protein n=1 Tax=Wuchereria bancrofti TaxID=6293 RepID=A0AAF5PL76_WUCBA
MEKGIAPSPKLIPLFILNFMRFQYLLILSLSLLITVKCCLPKWQTTDKTTLVCKIALDCPQNKPHVCLNGICIDYNVIAHRKTAKIGGKATGVCSTFLDCSPGLICSNGQCIKE